MIYFTYAGTARPRSATARPDLLKQRLQLLPAQLGAGDDPAVPMDLHDLRPPLGLGGTDDRRQRIGRGVRGGSARADEADLERVSGRQTLLDLETALPGNDLGPFDPQHDQARHDQIERLV